MGGVLGACAMRLLRAALSMTDEGSCWWEGWWTPKTAEQWWATPKQEWRLIGHKRRDETLWPYVHMQHMIGIIL